MEGRYIVEHWRNGRMLQEQRGHNGITLAGKQDLLAIYFRKDPLGAEWSAGLITNGLTSSPVPFVPNDDTDDMIVIATKEFTEYTTDPAAQSANRRVWPVSVESVSTEHDGGQDFTLLENTTTSMDFTVTGLAAAEDVFGMFLVIDVDPSVKLATTGELWSTAPFTSPISVDDGDVLKITYKIRIAY